MLIVTGPTITYHCSDHPNRLGCKCIGDMISDQMKMKDERDSFLRLCLGLEAESHRLGKSSLELMEQLENYKGMVVSLEGLLKISEQENAEFRLACADIYKCEIEGDYGARMGPVGIMRGQGIDPEKLGKK